MAFRMALSVNVAAPCLASTLSECRAGLYSSRWIEERFIILRDTTRK